MFQASPVDMRISVLLFGSLSASVLFDEGAVLMMADTYKCIYSSFLLVFVVASLYGIVLCQLPDVLVVRYGLVRVFEGFFFEGSHPNGSQIQAINIPDFLLGQAPFGVVDPDLRETHLSYCQLQLARNASRSVQRYSFDFEYFSGELLSTSCECGPNHSMSGVAGMFDGACITIAYIVAAKNVDELMQNNSDVYKHSLFSVYRFPFKQTNGRTRGSLVSIEVSASTIPPSGICPFRGSFLDECEAIVLLAHEVFENNLAQEAMKEFNLGCVLIECAVFAIFCLETIGEESRFLNCAEETEYQWILRAFAGVQLLPEILHCEKDYPRGRSRQIAIARAWWHASAVSVIFIIFGTPHLS